MAKELYVRRCLVCAEEGGTLRQFIAGSTQDICDFTAVDICERCLKSAVEQKLVYGIVMRGKGTGAN
jgi:hypothetical protein